MRPSVLILAAVCAHAAQEASDVTTIFVGGLPSSGTRVAAEALAHLGARGWGAAAWDSGVGCCEAMGLLARRVRATKARMLHALCERMSLKHSDNRAYNTNT